MQSERRPIAILDANAFISMSNIRNLSANTRLITSEDVLGEIKDIKTKEFVDSLPFQIETMQSDDKVFEIVKEFAKKTGDIASLSQIDMELIAIAYSLYKKEGLQHLLRKEPPPILEKDDLLQIVNHDQLSPSQYSDQEEEEETKLTVIYQKVEKSNQILINKSQQSHPNLINTKPQQNIKCETKNKQNEVSEKKEEQQWIAVPVKARRKVSSSSSQSDDEEAWVTSKNYEKKMAQMTATFKEDQQEEPNSFNIWLVSADFALQNVAVQMGIKLLSLDGRKITSIRRFIYECYLCWKKYRIYDEKIKLCNNCGYNSLSKIAYSIDEKGIMILHRKQGWKPNHKILEVKERKFEEQERKKKHQHARRRKNPSIFQS